ncbi:MAG TPA: hypothetical protein VN700_01040 [Vicinamibacterales bacterium]|nr:hypothetical protein [Vicinamibacterales bacterium]
MASRCRPNYQQVLDAFARGFEGEPDPDAYRELAELMAVSVHGAMTRDGITGSIGGYSSWLHVIWADRGQGMAGLGRAYLRLLEEGGILRQGASSMEGLLRAFRDPDAIREFLQFAQNARNANLPPQVREGVAVMFGRVTGINSARGGYYQAKLANVIGWNELAGAELRVDAAASLLNVDGAIVKWATDAGALPSHRLLDLLTKPGRLFPAATHPKAGRLLEAKGGPRLDTSQVWKYLGMFGDVDDDMLKKIRFVVNIPTVVDPRNPGPDMLDNIERIWRGLQAPELGQHPIGDDLIRRLFGFLEIEHTPSTLRATASGSLDEATRVGLQRLVIEWPDDIPVLDTLYRPRDMPGMAEGQRLMAEAFARWGEMFSE